MIEIIPGVLEQKWSDIEQKIELVLPFAKSIHIDLLDGVFAPNTSFSDPRPFKKYTDKVLLELHMMVKEPIEHVEPWASQGGIKRFIGQVEMMSDQQAFVTKAKAFGDVGLAVDAHTPTTAITIPYDRLDFLFAMTVKAGFSNQSFLPDCLEKVRLFREKTTIPIEVDGGINEKTIAAAQDAGATRFVSTGYLFGGTDPKARFDHLVSVCQASA